MPYCSRCSSTDTVRWGKAIFFLVNIVSFSSLLGLFSDATTGKGWRVHCYCWVGWKSMIPTEPHCPRAGVNAMASYSAVSDMTSVGAQSTSLQPGEDGSLGLLLDLCWLGMGRGCFSSVAYLKQSGYCLSFLSCQVSFFQYSGQRKLDFYGAFIVCFCLYFQVAGSSSTQPGIHEAKNNNNNNQETHIAIPWVLRS